MNSPIDDRIWPST